jgi:nucleoside-diphosphate-sugar epimerase
VVLHHAALVSVAESFDRPEDTHEVNLTGTLNVLLAARASGVRRVVLASSSAVYGDGPVPASEDQETRPQSPYAVTKLAGEAYASALAGALGLQTVCLRYFNVYGPRQDPSSEYSGVIARFAEALLGRKAPIVYGDGQQSRDFVFVGDVVRAVCLACKAQLAAHQVVNIGTGVGHTVSEVYDLLAQLAGAAQPPCFAPARPGEILHSRCNPSRAEALIGFRARVSLRDGLEQTLAWYRSQAAGSDA